MTAYTWFISTDQRLVCWTSTDDAKEAWHIVRRLSDHVAYETPEGFVCAIVDEDGHVDHVYFFEGVDR